MSADDVKDFERKLIQIFPLDQLALLKIVLEAYRSLLNDSLYIEGIISASSNFRLSYEFQEYLISKLK